MDNASAPLYSLKVAASQVGLSPRTLRLYEEAGLLLPARTGGNDQRLYSDQDLRWLRCIRDMIHGEKLTVPAIRRLLDLIPCWEIRHCTAEQAAACAAGLNIPQMARRGHGGVADAEPKTPQASAQPIKLKLIYGVREFGAVLPCSRCTHAERILRKVAAQFGADAVVVSKVDIASDEAAQYGVLLPPAVLVDDELLAAGQGVSETRLQQAVQQHLTGSE